MTDWVLRPARDDDVPAPALPSSPAAAGADASRSSGRTALGRARTRSSIRRGIGPAILEACELAAREAGFRTVDLVATLAGEPLYAAGGYVEVERYEAAMQPGLTLPVVKMTKRV